VRLQFSADVTRFSDLARPGQTSDGWG